MGIRDSPLLRKFVIKLSSNGENNLFVSSMRLRLKRVKQTAKKRQHPKIFATLSRVELIKRPDPP